MSSRQRALQAIAQLVARISAEEDPDYSKRLTNRLEKARHELSAGRYEKAEHIAGALCHG